MVDRIATEFTRFICLKVDASLTEKSTHPLPSLMVHQFWSAAVNFVFEYYQFCESLTTPFNNGRPIIINFMPFELEDLPVGELRKRYEHTLTEYIARFDEVGICIDSPGINLIIIISDLFLMLF